MREDWGYTLPEALEIAKVAAKYRRADIPCPGGVAERLLERIEELEARKVPNGGHDAVTVYLSAWEDAREYFGTDGDEDDPNDAQFHGAECARVQGPYRCTCDYDGQMEHAYNNAIDYLRRNR